ncbi:MAG: DNA replication and repair protein RecF [Prevotellaceae bacterium]|jgi:DNA replication and repair protein RecF|nr:DNA replication and repair protein RecF [Prevotellaceae bacterium]
MYLKHLALTDFKNIEEIEIDCSPVLNCFAGDNGEGKTNLLDSIYYLSMCKSHFKTGDTANIRDKEQYFIIKGIYDHRQEEITVSCGVKRNGKKSFKLNVKEYERLSEHIGHIPIVIITPSDTSLISDSGEERRKFLNAVIAQTDRDYLNALLKYNHTIAQRNKLLKSGNIDSELLKILNESLSNSGQVIYEKRAALIQAFTPTFREVYASISDSKESPNLLYRSDLSRGRLAELLEESLDRDLFMQHTTTGVHRDDLGMEIDGRAVRYAGSQGQQKTYLIAMKMAQFHIIKQHAGFSPILLLDDIFDKLDTGRVERLITLVVGNGFGQIFLTDSNKNRLDRLLEKTATDYKLFRIEAGKAELIAEPSSKSIENETPSEEI